MSIIIRRLAKATAVVVAIGGFLAAYSELRNDIPAAKRPEEKTVQATPAPPVIPPYRTDWVTGTGGGEYCRPRLAAYQAQYPDFTVSVYEPPGEHTTYYNPFKQDP